MRRLVNRVFPILCGFCAVLACAVLLGLVFVIAQRGLPAMSWHFLTEQIRQVGAQGGIFYNLVGTLILIGTALVVCAPIATGLALLQAVFVRAPWVRRQLGLFLYTLNGVPSIVFGIFGFVVFVKYLHWGKSWLVGGILLAIMILPTVTVALLERIDALPRKYIAAAAGLGLRQSQVVWSVILPQSWSGLITGALLGLARAAGETAPIMFTATIFAGATFPDGIRESPVLSLPLSHFHSRPGLLRSRRWRETLGLRPRLARPRLRPQHGRPPHSPLYMMKPKDNSRLAASPRASAPEEIFRISNLSVTARGKPILRQVDAVIEANQVFGIIGPSGAGKSTLLRCLNRLSDLTPELEVRGSIAYRDTSIQSPSLDPDALRARIGFLFQQPVVFPKSVLENTVFGVRRLRRLSKRQLAETAERALTEAALWNEVRERLHDSALTLSVGQQQRLCLARALAMNPEVILMDEPTSALDPKSTAAIEELILTLKERLTIVLVTHNIAQARRVTDWLACMCVRDGVGTIAERACCDAMLGDPQCQEVVEYLSHG